MIPELTITNYKQPVCLSELAPGELFIYVEGPMCVYRAEGKSRDPSRWKVRRWADDRPYEMPSSFAVYRVRLTHITVEIT